jgi:hypothetical protein
MVGHPPGAAAGFGWMDWKLRSHGKAALRNLSRHVHTKGKWSKIEMVD